MSSLPLRQHHCPSHETCFFQICGQGLTILKFSSLDLIRKNRPFTFSTKFISIQVNWLFLGGWPLKVKFSTFAETMALIYFLSLETVKRFDFGVLMVSTKKRNLYLSDGPFRKLPRLKLRLKIKHWMYFQQEVFVKINCRYGLIGVNQNLFDFATDLTTP